MSSGASRSLTFSRTKPNSSPIRAPGSESIGCASLFFCSCLAVDCQIFDAQPVANPTTIQFEARSSCRISCYGLANPKRVAPSPGSITHSTSEVARLVLCVEGAVDSVRLSLWMSCSFRSAGSVMIVGGW